ncbi:hypothetical protein [Nostoc sp. PA-18-2419]|uniref:hypothetical protein n=1 Tax=Nostoc sp. PA-18-2419 TaxID=2575443 RepID=UPI001107D95F|nr:hypothetical protein [Nostoc sp. PA-18-2419]
MDFTHQVPNMRRIDYLFEFKEGMGEWGVTKPGWGGVWGVGEEIALTIQELQAPSSKTIALVEF